MLADSGSASPSHLPESYGHSSSSYSLAVCGTSLTRMGEVRATCRCRTATLRALSSPRVMIPGRRGYLCLRYSTEPCPPAVTPCHLHQDPYSFGLTTYTVCFSHLFVLSAVSCWCRMIVCFLLVSAWCPGCVEPRGEFTVDVEINLTRQPCNSAEWARFRIHKEGVKWPHVALPALVNDGGSNRRVHWAKRIVADTWSGGGKGGVGRGS